ncbi:hypothetical protein JTF08_11235 [Micrococcaceae bacterium RIT802]|nr:hypothetical protein [Micrococcaceae bacterium RIT 802]
MGDTAHAELTVGLIADPGLPLELAEELKSWLPQRLASIVTDADWDVEVESLTLPLDDDGGVKLNANSKMLRDQRNWNYLVYLTDLPKYVENEPLLATVNAGYGTAMVVLPSLGLVRRKGLRKLVLQTVDALHAANSEDREYAPGESRFTRLFSRKDGSDDAESMDEFETGKGVSGRLMMQAGMVRNNRPWRLVPQLSTSMAAAIATGAFGVFYTSIWSMADYLSPLRLLVISLLSVAVMSTWLILANGLLERPRGVHHKERAITYNTATVATIVIAVAVMYVALFCIILAGSLIIINGQFISAELGHAAGFSEYINLSWLSASLGTLAGAVGSSFVDEQAVRRATFSSREFERRQISLMDKDEDKSEERAGSDS